MSQPDAPSQDEIDFWTARYGRPVSAADVTEINRNLVEFIELLAEWRREDESTQS